MLKISLFALCFMMVESACHGKLPPTQPPRNLGEDSPALRSNDLPPGPVAGEPVTPLPAAVGGSTAAGGEH